LVQRDPAKKPNERARESHWFGLDGHWACTILQAERNRTSPVTARRMLASPSHTAGYRVARRFGRATRAACVMACVPFLWTACNSSDATAPLSPPLVVPDGGPVAPAALVLDRVIGADTLRPGSIVVLEGSGFATGPLDNAVTIGGVAAT